MGARKIISENKTGFDSIVQLLKHGYYLVLGKGQGVEMASTTRTGF